MGYADPVIDPYNQARLLYLVQPEEGGEPLVLLYQGLSSHERGEVLICCSDLKKPSVRRTKIYACTYLHRGYLDKFVEYLVGDGPANRSSYFPYHLLQSHFLQGLP